MILPVASSGDVTVQLDSSADLTGWSLRLNILDGMSVDLQDEVVATRATFSVPPSLVGRHYELLAIDPGGDPHVAASGVTAFTLTPAVVHVAFDVDPVGLPFSVFVFDQGVPSAVWDIEHNLGRYPSVTVVDSAGTEVVGGIEYIDTNNIQITFSAGFSGRAFIGG